MRRRLLLVEDDPTLRQALTFNLAREGYEVATAADGEAALEAGRVHGVRAWVAAKTNPFALVPQEAAGRPARRIGRGGSTGCAPFLIEIKVLGVESGPAR